MLKADVVILSDTGMIARDIPSITTGLRGLAYWQIEVTGANRDLHSGLYGGAVANPIHELCKLIASLTDDNGKITIPEFYDDVLEVSVEEKAQLAKAPFNEENYKKSLGIKAVKGESGFITPERTGIRPAIDVCGIWGGYTGEGAKTVIPSKAFAKLSARLVPNQNWEKTANLVKKYLEENAPDSIQIKVDILHGGQGYVCPMTHPAYKAAEQAYEKVYEKKPVPFRSGGSISIIATMEALFGIKAILMGFGLESDAIHAPNENFSLEQFFNGIETITWFYKFYV
jgi:acetylornithine deacetylase/succinyl-diaminopimelate desuccinylase-like protein